MDSDSDCEATFFDDVKNVDWSSLPIREGLKIIDLIRLGV